VGTAASAVHAQLGRTNDFASPLSQADERARALDGAQVLLGAELHGARSELGGAPLLADPHQRQESCRLLRRRRAAETRLKRG
jgi:hypothetical protein